MLHDLPEQPAPAADAWAAADAADWAALRDLLHPRIRWTDRDIELHGRNQVLSHLRHARTPRPPTYVEVADGQVRRWTR